MSLLGILHKFRSQPTPKKRRAHFRPQKNVAHFPNAAAAAKKDTANVSLAHMALTKIPKAAPNGSLAQFSISAGFRIAPQKISRRQRQKSRI
jgi:hypothetical protein